MTRLLRSVILTLVLAGVVLGGYGWIRADQRDAAIAELERLNDQMRERLAARERMIERLSRTRRLAHLQVLEQRQDAGGGVQETDLRFIELDDDGTELARQAFTIPGDVVFVDAWTVKFDHRHVAAGHPLYGRALVLLRRIYSDRMAPIDGFAIDTPGAAPPGYATGDRGHFEQQLWRAFWEFASDPALAASRGVRVAQGEAVYKPVRAGRTYALSVDAAGGMSLTPLPPEGERRRGRGGRALSSANGR